jgi:hypothetical protein
MNTARRAANPKARKEYQNPENKIIPALKKRLAKAGEMTRVAKFKEHNYRR